MTEVRPPAPIPAPPATAQQTLEQIAAALRVASPDCLRRFRDGTYQDALYRTQGRPRSWTG